MLRHNLSNVLRHSHARSVMPENVCAPPPKKTPPQYIKLQKQFSTYWCLPHVKIQVRVMRSTDVFSCNGSLPRKLVPRLCTKESRVTVRFTSQHDEVSSPDSICLQSIITEDVVTLMPLCRHTPVTVTAMTRALTGSFLSPPPLCRHTPVTVTAMTRALTGSSLSPPPFPTLPLVSTWSVTGP